jgi:hypothetical protein
MPTFAENLRTYLVSNGTIAGLIGTRIYPLSIPQTPDFPAIAYQVSLDDYYEQHGGSENLARTVFTIAVVAKTYGEVLTIANAIKSILHNFRGNIGTTPVQGIQFQEDRQDDDKELGLYSIELDFAADIEP